MAEFLSVERVLDALNLKDSMQAAEFGCGSAAFTLALAKLLKKGRVYALDIQQEKLSALKGKAAIEKANNVIPIRCDLEQPNGSTLQSNLLDAVVIPNLLFQVENKHAILEEARRVIKPGGEMLIIDWLIGSPLSPETGLITPEELKIMGQGLSLAFQKEFAAGDYHFAVLFTKQ